jgi:hypothetical protein
VPTESIEFDAVVFLSSLMNRSQARKRFREHIRLATDFSQVKKFSKAKRFEQGTWKEEVNKHNKEV